MPIGKNGADCIENIVCCSQFPRGQGMPYQAGPHGEALGSVRSQKE